MENVLENAYKENVSVDVKQKPCLATPGESSSVDKESEHAFPDTESTNESTAAIKDNPTLDTDEKDIAKYMYHLWSMVNMLKYTYKENVSAGARKTQCLDTSGQSSSLDTDGKVLFSDIESTNTSTDEDNSNSTLDTDGLSSSLDTDGEALFSDIESTNTSTDEDSSNSTLDTDEADMVRNSLQLWTYVIMLTNPYNENVSAGAKKKQCLDTAGQSSSLDTDGEHQFPDTESTNTITEADKDNPTIDTKEADIVRNILELWRIVIMLTMPHYEIVSACEKKKQCLDTAGQSSSVDTESEDLFADTATMNAITKIIKDNPTINTKGIAYVIREVLERENKENLSADAKKKQYLDATVQSSSSVDTGSEHLFPDTENMNAITEENNDDPTLDTKDIAPVIRQLLEKENNENLSADTKKKQCLDTAVQSSSSVDTDSEHLFPDTENMNAITEVNNDDHTLRHERHCNSHSTIVKRKNNEDLSADAKKKQSLDTAGQSSSSVDIKTEPLFPDTERTNTITKAVNDDPTRDTDDLDIPDTLTLARMDRENQGSWEFEYSYGGEADLRQHYTNCTKDPDHKNFIPVDKFTIKDLPKGYRDPYIVQYIRAQSDLTVRVSVSYVIKDRPTTVPGSCHAYPGYNNRGRKKMTVGTGCVGRVTIVRDLIPFTCECENCRDSPEPATHYAEIHIHTAKHLVFDDFEAKHTTCHLFFDRGGIPDTCSGVVKLTGLKLGHSDIQKDQCVLRYHTHDFNLIDRLGKTCAIKDTLMNKLLTRLPRITQYKTNLDVAETKPLSCTVSHPHGCSKHISIGYWRSVSHWTSVSGYEKEGFTYEYTTATCPGSSGAQLFIPHTYASEWKYLDLMTIPRIHRGKSNELPDVNYFEALCSSIRDRDLNPRSFGLSLFLTQYNVVIIDTVNEVVVILTVCK